MLLNSLVPSASGVRPHSSPGTARETRKVVRNGRALYRRCCREAMSVDFSSGCTVHRS